jgi:hypothetical protein
MFLLEVAGDVYQGYGLKIDVLWAVIYFFNGGSYLVIRFLHKHTELLNNDEENTSSQKLQGITNPLRRLPSADV